jgi:hypothetical protein
MEATAAYHEREATRIHSASLVVSGSVQDGQASREEIERRIEEARNRHRVGGAPTEYLPSGTCRSHAPGHDLFDGTCVGSCLSED